MSIEKFVCRNRVMLQRLEQIVATSAAGGLFEHSLRFAPEVRDLLAAQERLLNAAERVLELCSPDAADMLRRSSA